MGWSADLVPDPEVAVYLAAILLIYHSSYLKLHPILISTPLIKAHPESKDLGS